MDLVIGLLVGSVPIGIAVGMVIAARTKRARYHMLASAGAEVDGRVVGLTKPTRHHKSPRAIVEFTDRDGRSHRVESTIGTVRWRDYQDSPVRVAYDPAAPLEARIREDHELWLESVRKLLALLIGMGLAIMGLGIAAHLGVV